MKRSLIVMVMIVMSLFVVSAQSSTVCCERTTSGALCQDVPADECASGAQQVPTSCDSTSFCQAGTCFDSTEGVCMSNTPQLVCNENGGIWSADQPPQCSPGCCILGDQAAFVSLVRCKLLSAQLGLETNYDTSIKNELSCIATVQAQDKGACVYDFEFEQSCKFTTRADCDNLQIETGETVEGAFYKDVLCSAESLGTVCGPSTQTTCLDGRDEVYFVDTCGNPANIYDASKIDDQAYWANVIPKDESCGVGSGNGNAENPNCGNCNYLQGSYCRSEDIADANPTYGDFVCADLNCPSTSDGSSRLHGESWCVYDDAGGEGEGDNSVGSRYYKHICINGEEVLEQCGDQREEVCIEGEVNGFSQAACRVNRWQDCLQQYTEFDCENTDRRDCLWIPGERIYVPEDEQTLAYQQATGACVPQVPPGLNFWDSVETQAVCAQGDAQIIVNCEKGLFDDEAECDLSDAEIQAWVDSKANVCATLGDCGPGTNFVGTKGAREGFKWLQDRL